MTDSVAPLPFVKKSIASRVLLKIDGLHDDFLGLYSEQQLIVIERENPMIAKVLEECREKTSEKFGEEAGLLALLSGIAVYRTLQQQTKNNFRKLFLKAKQLERSKRKRDDRL